MRIRETRKLGDRSRNAQPFSYGPDLRIRGEDGVCIEVQRSLGHSCNLGQNAVGEAEIKVLPSFHKDSPG